MKTAYSQSQLEPGSCDLSFDAFYERLQQLMGDEKPYKWAARLGLKSTLANIDRYKHIPRPHTLKAIAEAAGCNYDWLAKGEGEPFPPAEPASPGTPPVADSKAPRVAGTIVAGSGKVDPKRLELAIRALSEWETERGVHISDDRRPAVIALLYDYLENAEDVSLVLRALG